MTMPAQCSTARRVVSIWQQKTPLVGGVFCISLARKEVSQPRGGRLED
jgi:hypothetical protein